MDVELSKIMDAVDLTETVLIEGIKDLPIIQNGMIFTQDPNGHIATPIRDITGYKFTMQIDFNDFFIDGKNVKVRKRYTGFEFTCGSEEISDYHKDYNKFLKEFQKNIKCTLRIEFKAYIRKTTVSDTKTFYNISFATYAVEEIHLLQKDFLDICRREIINKITQSTSNTKERKEI